MLAIPFRDEPVRLEPDNLQTLIDQLGERAADDVMCRAMEELAIRLADLPALFTAGHLGEVERLSHGMVAIAEQIGLSALSRAAAAVCDCARQGNGNALAATIGRLERIGDRSLSTVWDLRDMSV